MKNLHVIDAQRLTISPGWAVAWNFVPIMFLWMPVRAVNQIWRGSMSPIDGVAQTPNVIGWWWGTWIASNIIGNASARLGGFLGSGPVATPTQIAVLDTLSDGLGLVSVYLMLSFMRRIGAAQEKLRA